MESGDEEIRNVRRDALVPFLPGKLPLRLNSWQSAPHPSRISRVMPSGRASRRPCPTRGRMAQRAIGREAGGDVVRIGGAVEVRLMAPDACRRQGGEVAVYVTRSAGHRYVCSRQGERRFVVAEHCSRPSRGRVAQRAIGRKAGGDVGRVRGSGEAELTWFDRQTTACRRLPATLMACRVESQGCIQRSRPQSAKA